MNIDYFLLISTKKMQLMSIKLMEEYNLKYYFQIKIINY